VAGPLDPKDWSPQCSVTTTPGPNADLYDLVVVTKVGKKKTTSRYSFRDGTYQPTK
jgi:hypothetical protein